MSYMAVFVPDENGKLVRKIMPEAEAAKNPDVRYQMRAAFGSYRWTDEEHMEETKAALLEQLLDSIKELAKNDEFWILKKPSDYENFVHPVLPGAIIDVPQEAKDGKSTIGWIVRFPQFERLYTKDEAVKIKNMLAACYKNCEEA